MGGCYNFTSSLSPNTNNGSYTESKSNFKTIDEVVKEEIKKPVKKEYPIDKYHIKYGTKKTSKVILIFGLGGAVITYFIGPLLNYYYTKIKLQIAISICTILIISFGADAVYSSKHPNIGKGITSYKQNCEKYII